MLMSSQAQSGGGTHERRSRLSEANRRCIVDGVALAYRDEGAGVPVVCLHAVGHGSGDFAPLRERAASSCRLITLDWPGHGESAPDHKPASAARCAELLSGFVKQLDLPPVVLLGNSIGGSAAIRQAAAEPGSVRALVLCDSAGLMAPSAGVRAFCRFIARGYRRGSAGAWWFDWFYRAQYARLLPGPGVRARRELIVKAGAEMAPVLAEAWASFAEPEADIRELVPSVDVPVLLAWARSDPYNDYSAAKPALRRFASAETRLFAGAHCPFLERPDEFASSFVDFISRL